MGGVVLVSPGTRNLYEMLEIDFPDIYEYVRDLDTSLAELHLSGMQLIRTRQMLIEKCLEIKRLDPKQLIKELR